MYSVFINLRKQAQRSALSIPADVLALAPFELVQATTTVMVPFDVDGSLMEIAKELPYEAPVGNWRAYSNDFLIGQGAITPIKTYRGDVMNVLDSLTPEQIKAMFNQTVESTKETV